MPRSQVDILLGTPLLAGQQVAAKKLALDGARFLILDEGDRLLDEQFVEQVDAVLAACTAPDLVRRKSKTCFHEENRVQFLSSLWSR